MAVTVPCAERPAAWFSRRMATDLHADLRVDRLEVVDAVRSRLNGIAADGRDVDALIEAALDELTPATITTYLPILVERRVRDRLDHG